MTDFQINDYLLEQEAQGIARDAFDEWRGDNDDEIDESIWQTCDGHEWVIYNYKALMICAHCHTDDGEQWLEDTGMEPTTSITELASRIVFATLYTKAMQYVEELREAA